MLSNLENHELERAVAIAEQNKGELPIVSSQEDSQMRLDENCSNAQAETYAEPETETLVEDLWLMKEDVHVQTMLPNVEEVCTEPEPQRMLGVGKLPAVINSVDVCSLVEEVSITEEVLVDVVLRDSKSKSGDYSNLLDNLIDSTAESTRPNIFNKIKKWFCIGFSTSFIGCTRTKGSE